jgi:Carbamoyl-phosphate synthase small chain, CPSase domain
VTGFLVLEDGTAFRGESVSSPGSAFGEAVFTTAMSGYQEVVTDPSFSAQIVCFTAPMVGNYGVAPARSESARPHARGVVMREARGPEWTDWLHERGVPALTGIDTRTLVLRLRDRGAMRAAIVCGDDDVGEALRAVREQPAMSGAALAGRVSTREPYVAAADGDVRVAVVDYGVKRSILRRLAAAGAAVTVFPHDADADTLATFDGVLLSICSAVRPSSASASGTSFSRGRQASRRSSSHSATAARTIPCSSVPRAASSSRARTTASPSRRATTAPRRTCRCTTAQSRGSHTRSSARARCSSTPRRGPGPTTRGR